MRERNIYLELDPVTSRWERWTFQVPFLQPSCHVSWKKISWVEVHPIDDVGAILVDGMGLDQDVGMPVLGELLIRREGADIFFRETCFDLPKIWKFSLESISRKTNADLYCILPKPSPCVSNHKAWFSETCLMGPTFSPMKIFLAVAATVLLCWYEDLVNI